MSESRPQPLPTDQGSGYLTQIVVFILSVTVLIPGYSLLALARRNTSKEFELAAQQRGLFDETSQSLRLATWELSVVAHVVEGLAALLVIGGVILILSTKGSATGAGWW